MGSIKLLMILIVIGILAFGCVAQQDSPQQDADPGTISTKRPSFDILSPLEDANIVITSDKTDLMVRLRPNNLALVNPNSRNKYGEGHFQISLDGDEIMTAETSHNFKDIDPGTHTLRVEVMQNDNSSYEPKIMKTITFTIERLQVEAEPKTYEIGVGDFAFSPAYLEIRAGDTIIWKNNDQMPHTATSMGSFDTGVIQPGRSASVTFNTSGDYNYICTIHPNMKGKIRVN